MAAFAGGGSSVPSLGILMLAAVARQEGCRCTVVDASALGLTEPELLERLAAIRPDILCLSSTTLAIFNASDFAVAAKRLLPELTVVVGGPHVTAAARRNDAALSGFRHRGGRGGGADPGRTAPRPAGGGVTRCAWRAWSSARARPCSATGRRPFIADLDSLPLPAWDLLEGFPERYLPAPFKVRQLPAATLVTSRGCPNTCIFCDRSVFGSSCHAYSADT